MNAGRSRKSVRCAIYTRVSTDAGLDQEFNSLDAQYEGGSAYIRSQAHAGWTLLRKRYDDGGFSGGSTDRPALQQLLADVRAGKIDIIVVYKVDRLTRSLADFAKLVELFDAHAVSFVSVTQQFNTTTSMGRLTLNVLLSFAQFEREVTSERIRDKIGASKRKGLWVGGVVPLGYHAKDRKITAVDSEAKTVRHIFRRYLELGSLNLLLADLRSSGIKTRVRPLSTGRTTGGIPFTRGSLAYLLRNRFYVGEVRYKNEVLPGEQPVIVERKLFDAVQGKLEQQRTNHTAERHATGSLLTGIIFNASGIRMTPTYALKKGIRYRYYIASTLLQGQKTKSGKPDRIPAEEVERLVAHAVRARLKSNTSNQQHASSNSIDDLSDTSSTADMNMILRNVRRVNVAPDHLNVRMALSPRSQGDHGKTADKRNKSNNDVGGSDAPIHEISLRIPWTKRPSKQPREIIPPADASQRIDKRPIRSETRAKLVMAIAQGRRWLDELIVGRVTNVEQIARRERCSIRQVNRAISLAFLAPNLTKAAAEGRLPRGIGVATLRHLPLEWSRQHDLFGLAI